MEAATHRFVKDMTDEEVLAAVEQYGGIRPASRALNVAFSGLHARLQRIERGVARRVSQNPAPASRRSKAPAITRESLHAALVPPNLCRVREFLDTLDEDSRDVVEEALGYSAKDFPAAAVVRWLEGLGYKASELPGTEALNDHRAGRGRCRCRG